MANSSTILFVAFALTFCMCEDTKRHQPLPRTTFLHSCDDPWKWFNGHCYLVANVKRTWNDASEYCENMNSYLIEVTTDEELEFVSETLLRAYGRDPFYGSGRAAYFWTGATDRDLRGTFVYQHSDQQVPEVYWREGEPDDVWRGPQCAYMWRKNMYYDDFEVFAIGCDRDFNFVCEKS